MTMPEIKATEATPRAEPGDSGASPRPAGEVEKPSLAERLNLTPYEIEHAKEDLKLAIGQRWFWVSLAWNDIVHRYRGSMLGPFWLTLTTGIFIAGLGPLYATLFKLDPKQYLPFMAVGMLVWNFITASINESCRTFMDGSGIMKQMKLPRITMVFHVVWRNIIVFAHNLPIYVLVAYFCDVPINGWTLAVIPGFVLLCLNLLWIGLLLAMLCLRFRDVLQIVASILLLGFFFTPVMWNPKLQSINAWLVNLNPFAALIDLVRAPLLGEPWSIPLLVLSSAVLLIGTAITSVLFVRYRRHIIYWV